MTTSPETQTPQAINDTQSHGGSPEIGLGIDAGGTYTDVVVFDFANDAIAAKSKALTTKWNYTEGIEAALEQIPGHYLEQVGLVSVSTTLATNAIVENHGQKAGVLLMPPYGRFQDRELSHTPKAVVKGQMDMDGTVLEPVDPAQIESVAKEMIREHGVRAFAVSGCGATINAAHELEVKRILQDTAGLSVTCGHTLSEMLGMYQRAATAIFNARVVPFIETFLHNLQTALDKRNIHAPVMVVKGDGTLMSTEMAKERPVETIFSGPAASVAGARRLTNLANALVVDIGGTTTDIAAIRDNRVEICSKGNVVAGVHTHVKALNMRTKGLGGDSAIHLKAHALKIGPMRVTPVSYLAEQFPKTAKALDFIEEEPTAYRSDTGPMQLLYVTKHKEELALEPLERKVLDILASRPHSVEELSQALDLRYGGIWLYSRLLSHNLIGLSALTPTDVLHAEGRVRLWDEQTAGRVCRLYASLIGVTYEAFAKQALDTFAHELALELFEKVMGDDTQADGMDESAVTQAILEKWLTPQDGGLRVSMTLPYPVIGVGAPAGELLPEAAGLFNTGCTVPDDFDVANAIGAITSAVSITRHVKVAPKENGSYGVWGLAEGHEFEDLQEAVDVAKAELLEHVTMLAHKAGILNPEIETTEVEETAATRYGGEVFLGTLITATTTSKPEAIGAGQA